MELSKTELAKYPFDKTVFTVKDCIPDDKGKSIVGKVVVINAEPKRYEYQHPAYQLVLADGGNGAAGGRDRFLVTDINPDLSSHVEVVCCLHRVNS